MLLFTRIVGLGYLFNFVILGAWIWTASLLFSIVLIVLTTYSCYLTIILRAKHENALMYYQHMAYAVGLGRSSIILISLFLSFDYCFNPSQYFTLVQQVFKISVCRLLGPDEKYFGPRKYALPLALIFVCLPLCLTIQVK